MVTVTGTAQKSSWDRGVLPPVEQVRPGLWSVPVPVPINPLRYVLVYAFELSGGGVGLVDAGWDTEQAWDALTDGLAVFGARPGDVRAVVVTHVHPDHYGLADRVRRSSGAWVGLHPADAALLEGGPAEAEELLRAMRGLLELSGVPEPTLPDPSEASMQARTFLSMEQPDVLLHDARVLELPGWDLRVIWTPGHSPGHVCLYSDDQRLLLSGDHVLPRITPNISFHSQRVPNPLGDYLDSLARMRALTPDEILPGHEYRFSDLPSRLTEIEHHHAARLTEIERTVGKQPGSTAWELAAAVEWSRPWGELSAFMRRAASGETFAHLALLVRRGRVRRDQGVPARFSLEGGSPRSPAAPLSAATPPCAPLPDAPPGTPGRTAS